MQPMEGHGNLSIYLGFLNQEGICCQKVLGRGILQFILGTKEAESTEHISKILTHFSPVEKFPTCRCKGQSKTGVCDAEGRRCMKNFLTLKFPYPKIRTC